MREEGVVTAVERMSVGPVMATCGSLPRVQHEEAREREGGERRGSACCSCHFKAP